jgi:hypothetical protein
MDTLPTLKKKHPCLPTRKYVFSAAQTGTTATSKGSAEHAIQPRRLNEPCARSLDFAPATFGNAAKRTPSKALVTRRRISTDCPCAELCIVLCQRCESAGTKSDRAPTLVHGSTNATPTTSRSHNSEPRAQSSYPDFIGHPHAQYSQVCTDSRTRHQ